MLQQRHLATIRAALRYWRDEMCPHDATFTSPYFDVAGLLPLNGHEIDALSADVSTVRYAFYDRLADRLVATALLTESCQELSSNRAYEIATVFLPQRPTEEGSTALPSVPTG